MTSNPDVVLREARRREVPIVNVDASTMPEPDSIPDGLTWTLPPFDRTVFVYTDTLGRVVFDLESYEYCEGTLRMTCTGHGDAGVFGWTNVEIERNFPTGDLVIAKRWKGFGSPAYQDTALIESAMFRVVDMVTACNTHVLLRRTSDNRKPWRRGQPIRDKERKFVQSDYVLISQSVASNKLRSDTSGHRVTPHLRRSHLRKLPTGKVVRVKACQIHAEQFCWSEHGKDYRVVSR